MRLPMTVRQLYEKLKPLAESEAFCNSPVVCTTSEDPWDEWEDPKQICAVTEIPSGEGPVVLTLEDLNDSGEGEPC